MKTINRRKNGVTAKGAPRLHRDNKGIKGAPIINGNGSIRVKEIKDALNLDMLKEVDKLQIEGMVDRIVARTAAVTVNGYTNQILGEAINQFGQKVMSYEADLITTQSKLADMQSDLQFYLEAIRNLKAKYQKEPNDDLMQEILNIQNQINKQEGLVQSTLDLRNKIRKEVDRQNLVGKKLLMEEEINRPHKATKVNIDLL